METQSTLYILTLYVIGALSQCLENVAVSKISSTTATLTWDYVCDPEKVETFKIDYTHLQYKACKELRKDVTKPAGFGTVEVLTQTVLLERLHPYSEYTFQVRVVLKVRQGRRPENAVVNATTDFSLPKARAEQSNVDYSYRTTASRLVFNWSPPLASTRCDKFYAELGSYLYNLQGINEWNREFVQERSLNLTDTMVEVVGLEPYSDYLFLLYISNSAGGYDSDVYLRLEGRTQPSAPDPPQALRSEPTDQGTIHLQWRPQFPFKGELSHYELRWKITSGLDWLHSETLDPVDTLCRSSEVPEGQVCHTLAHLTPGNYTVQVRSYNKDIAQPSEWSEAGHAQVDGSSAGYFDLTNILIISFFTVLVVLVLSYVLYRLIHRRRKKGFDKVLTDDFNPPIVRQSGRHLFSDSSSYTKPLRTVPPQRSVQDPLPPLPDASEPIYSDLNPKLEEEEDDYLKPNPVRVESCESLDEQGYLRPNFNRFQRMDTSGSYKEHSPPVIPPVSYLSGT